MDDYTENTNERIHLICKDITISPITKRKIL